MSQKCKNCQLLEKEIKALEAQIKQLSFVKAISSGNIDNPLIVYK